MTGRVVHFEIPADDVSRAESFYRSAFGWTMSSLPGMGYTLVSTTPTDESGMPTEPGAINGGMLQRQGPATAPVIVVDVADINQLLVRVEELGGKTLRDKQPVGEMGFAAYFSDTEGNVIGLWQSAGSA